MGNCNGGLMLKCNQCGTENENNAVFCQNCGAEIKTKKSKKGINIFTKIGLGVLGFIVLAVVVLSLISTPGVTEFDRTLIKSVNDGASADSLIPYIKENSEIGRLGAKRGYDAMVSAAQSTGNDTNKAEAQTDYDKEMSYIQKVENVRISFVNRGISEDAFIKELMRLYKEEN